MAILNESILDSTKKALGLESDYDVFDSTIIMHINSVFSTLQQLGVGPVSGFMIEDDSAKWPDFTSDTTLNSVKTYMYIRVRLLFDPPSTSHASSALDTMAKELEWRLNVHVESPSNIESAGSTGDIHWSAT